MNNWQRFLATTILTGLLIASPTAADEILLGDVNQDGSVDLLDVQPFVALLTSGTFVAEADMNQDDVFNLLDVGPFVDAIANGPFDHADR